MDENKKKMEYINLFENKDIKNGIRININSAQGALKAIKEIFHNKKPNYVFGLENVKVNDYDIIMTSWREWLVTGKMSKVEYAHRELLKKMFNFHIRTEDHVICFQSYNLREALLMCRINKKYINVVIPQVEGVPLNTSIIATYT